MSQLPSTAVPLPKQIDSKTIFSRIKKTDYAGAPVTLWIVYKRHNTGDAAIGKTPAENFHFAVRRLDTEKSLDTKLAGIVQKKVEQAKRLENYTFEGAVEKETALVEEISETSFSTLTDLIARAGPYDVVSTAKHLHAAYGYLIHLQPKKGPALMAFRRVQASWKAKRVFGLINTLLKGKVLVTAEEERIFRFEQKIDFFAVDGLIFVLDKSGFESALNFRAGMEKKRDSLVQTLIATNLYLNLDLVSKLSSTHVRWLKKLAGAHRLGKCTEADWVTRLIACCKEKGWPVVLVNGQVEITEANCELIVRLMNYDLLESPVDHAMFKIDGAKEAF